MKKTLNNFTCAIFIFFVLGITTTQANKKCNCHTWHNVTAYKGSWTATISAVHEAATFYNGDCNVIPNDKNNAFIVSDSNTTLPQFGYKPGPLADFDTSYALTFVRTDKHSKKHIRGSSNDVNVTSSGGRKLFQSMACVFVVAAAGPAMPDVRAEEYNGAICMWKRVDGEGESYYLDYNE